MATTDLIGTPERADRGDTAPLPLAARKAMHRLERAFADRSTAEVRRVVVRFEIAAATVDRLSAMDARDMSPAQFDHLADAQERMAEYRATLAAADRLDLIEVA